MTLYRRSVTEARVHGLSGPDFREVLKTITHDRINGIRVVAAGALGLYPGVMVAALSVAASVPAVAGVAVGSRLRDVVSTRVRRGAVLGLLTVIALQLLRTGLGVP